MEGGLALDSSPFAVASYDTGLPAGQGANEYTKSVPAVPSMSDIRLKFW